MNNLLEIYQEAIKLGWHPSHLHEHSVQKGDAHSKITSKHVLCGKPIKVNIAQQFHIRYDKLSIYYRIKYQHGNKNFAINSYNNSKLTKKIKMFILYINGICNNCQNTINTTSDEMTTFPNSVHKKEEQKSHHNFATT